MFTRGFLVCALLVAVALTGCAWTGTESQIMPTHTGDPFSRVVVLVDVEDPVLQRDAEKRFVREFDSKGVEAIAYSRLMRPMIEYATDEQMRILEADGADAILFVSRTSSGARSSYVPQRSTTKGKVNPYTGKITAKTTTSGGYTMTKPWANFTVELFNLGSGGVVWIGYSETRGNAYSRSKTLLRSLADKATGQLVKDGIVRSSKPARRKYE